MDEERTLDQLTVDELFEVRDSLKKKEHPELLEEVISVLDEKRRLSTSMSRYEARAYLMSLGALFASLVTIAEGIQRWSDREFALGNDVTSRILWDTEARLASASLISLGLSILVMALTASDPKGKQNRWQQPLLGFLVVVTFILFGSAYFLSSRVS